MSEKTECYPLVFTQCDIKNDNLPDLHISKSYNLKPNSVNVLLSFQNISQFLKSLPRSRLSQSKHLSCPRYNETVFFVVTDTGTPQKPGEIHRLLNQYIIVKVVHCLHCLLSLVKVS